MLTHNVSLHAMLALVKFFTIHEITYRYALFKTVLYCNDLNMSELE
jgi:hypothetical protein